MPLARLEQAGWYHDAEARATVRARIDFEATAVRLDNLLAGEEAEPDALALSRREGAEEARLYELLAHADARIRDAEEDQVARHRPGLDREFARALRPHRFERVDDEVLHDVLHALGLDRRDEPVGQVRLHVVERLVRVRVGFE